MKIVGFTIIRNAVINDYPVVEAVTSILPVVDQMIISIGDSEDETEALIRSISSDKIVVVHSTWDMTLRQGGKVLAVETDKAMEHIPDDADWAFYIQADEVVHEKYHPAILEAAAKYKDDKEVEGLLFKYLHFYGTYDYVGDSRRWYHREIRMIRKDKSISAYRDAQGFRKGKTKLKVKLIDAYIYHYGWVKSPKQMKQKMKHVSRFWNEDSENWQGFIQSEDVFNFDDFDSLVKFDQSHPAVMQHRVKNQNWNVPIDISKKRFSFKDRLLYHFEKLTGIRPFDFKNYKLLK
jgi:hypothetical protein